jgi:hypothetical protein
VASERFVEYLFELSFRRGVKNSAVWALLKKFSKELGSAQIRGQIPPNTRGEPISTTNTKEDMPNTATFSIRPLVARIPAYLQLHTSARGSWLRQKNCQVAYAAASERTAWAVQWGT